MNKKQLVLIVSSVALLLPVVTLAVPCPTSGPGALSGGDWLKCIMGNVRSLILWPLFAGLVVIMFIWVGVLFLMAKGEPGKLETAKKAAIYAVIGVFVGIFAYSAYAFVTWLIGA